MQNMPAGLRNPWLQLALSILFATASELFLKRGASETAHLTDRLAWTGISGLASPCVWLGILFVVLGFVSWLHVLRYIPLVVAFPISQVVHALVPFCSWIFLGESISPLRWCGIGLVSLGLAIMAKPVARLEEKL